MELLSLLFAQRGRLLSRFLRTQTAARLITILLFLAVLAGVGWVVYEGFSSVLLAAGQDPTQSEAVTLYIYELASLVLMALVAASTALTGLPTLFQGRKDAWIAASPRPGFLFAYRSVSSLLASAWPVLLLALPASLAAGSLAGHSGLRVLVSLLAYLLLTLATASATLAVSLGCARLLGPALKPGRLAALLGCLALAGGLALWHWARHLSLTDLLSTGQLGAGRLDPAAVGEHFRLLPTHWAAQALLAVQTGRSTALQLWELTLCALAGIALLMASGFLYPAIWQAMQEGRFQAAARPTTYKRRPDGLLSRTPSLATALFAKEALSLVRERRNALWITFLLIVWLIQAGLLHGFGSAGNGTGLAQLALLQAAQTLVSLYFAATLVLRFAFPALSMETRTAWALASAPVSLAKVFFAKFATYALLVAAVGTVIGTGNLALLGIAGSGLAISLASFIIGSAFLVGLGLTMGTLFPNFETDDPELLTTTLPGIAVTLLSVGYGAVTAYALHWSVARSDSLPLALVLGGSLIVLAALLAVGSRAAQRIEFGTGPR